MANLEEKILNPVVDEEQPEHAQYNDTDSDNDKDSDNDNNSSNQNQLNPAFADLPNNPNDIRMPNIRQGFHAANTGPKGVIADYKDAQVTMSLRLLEEKIERERVLMRMAVGDEKFILEPPKESVKKDNKEDEDEDDDEDDDEIFQQYKQNRMKSLHPPNIYSGHLTKVSSKDEFLKFLKEIPRHVIILHLFSPVLESSVRMQYILDNLSNQFPFIIREYIALTKTLGQSFSDRDVFNFLKKENIFSLHQLDDKEKNI